MLNAEPGQIVSSIFLHPKKDGSYRLNLNLKQFNTNVVYHHFKMDSIQTIVQLVTPNCFMASLDLKDAYYSLLLFPPICFINTNTIRKKVGKLQIESLGEAIINPLYLALDSKQNNIISGSNEIAETFNEYFFYYWRQNCKFR